MQYVLFQTRVLRCEVQIIWVCRVKLILVERYAFNGTHFFRRLRGKTHQVFCQVRAITQLVNGPAFLLKRVFPWERYSRQAFGILRRLPYFIVLTHCALCVLRGPNELMERRYDFPFLKTNCAKFRGY